VGMAVVRRQGRGQRECSRSRTLWAIVTSTKHPENGTTVSRQAGDAERDKLVAEVSRMVWEWEGSDELASEFARRLVDHILGRIESTRATPSLANRMTVTAS
jgi:hypothetical protein